MKTKSKPVTKLEKLISEHVNSIGKAGKFDHVAVVTLNLLKTKAKLLLHGSKKLCDMLIEKMNLNTKE